jgi:hypothetical protein
MGSEKCVIVSCELKTVTRVGKDAREKVLDDDGT